MKNKKYIIAIDGGKDDTKYAGKEIGGSFKKKGKFATRMDVLSKNKEVETGKDSHVVKFEDEHIFVGNLAAGSDMDPSKAKKLHKMSIYTAITKVLDPHNNNNDVILVTSVPATQYTDKTSKKQYAELLKNDGQVIKINVDGKDYNFSISKIIIKGEGTGIAYSKAELFIDEEVLVVDLGGLNANVIGFTDGKIRPTHHFDLEAGMNYFLNILGEKMLSHTENKKLSTTLLKKFADKELLKFKGKEVVEATPDILKAKDEYLESVFSQIQARIPQFETKYSSLVFLGGTSAAFEKQLKGLYDYAQFFEDGDMLHVEGLLKMAEAKYK